MSATVTRIEARARIRNQVRPLDRAFREEEGADYYESRSKRESAAIGAWCFAGCLALIVVGMVAKVTMSAIEAILSAMGWLPL